MRALTAPPNFSTGSAQRLSAIAIAIVMFLFITASIAQGDKVKDIRPAIDRPLAPRGGVMLIPLAARRPGTNWPPSIDVQIGGRTISGRVLWFEPRKNVPLRARQWTDDAGGYTVRFIQPEDDTFGSGGAVLAVRVPIDGEGTMRIAGERVRPVWRDVPSPGVESHASPLERTGAPDRPDPNSPFAYWRWSLLAEALGRTPPPLDAMQYGEAGTLVAEHQAAAWRIALDRLAGIRADFAREVRAALTRIGKSDDQQLIAMWVADPVRIAPLLNSLLDFDRSDRAVAVDVGVWLNTMPALIAWAERANADEINIVLGNCGAAEEVVRLAWEHSDDIPLAVEIGSGELRVIRVERPVLPARDRFEFGLPEQERPQDVLRLETRTQIVRVAGGPRVAEAQPPGVYLPAPRAPITLAEAQAQQQRNVEDAFTTVVHVRRLRGRWEVFLECKRPPPDVDDGASTESETPAAPLDVLSRFAQWRDVREVEAVTLLIGPEDEPTHVITIPERGWQRNFLGRQDDALQIHRRSYTDRWYCRIVLPNAWLPEIGPEGGSRLLVGASRSHAECAAVETTPHTSAPWRQSPGRIAIDLSAWDEFE